MLSFFFKSSADHRDLHSFPTRRSSDLGTSSEGLDHETLSRPCGVTGLRCRARQRAGVLREHGDRKSTRLNSSHLGISYAVFCLKKKKKHMKKKSIIIYKDYLTIRSVVL